MSAFRIFLGASACFDLDAVALTTRATMYPKGIEIYFKPARMFALQRREARGSIFAFSQPPFQQTSFLNPVFVGVYV